MALGQRLDELARRAGLSGMPSGSALALAGLAVAAAGWCAWRWWPASAEVPFDGRGRAEAGGSSEQSASAEASVVVVHVVGAVARPGVYVLPTGSRVGAAVEAAGGLLDDAAPQGVNLARFVRDGEQLCVPTIGEAAAPTAAAGASGAPGGLVDINTADVALLDTLPGIGPATAERIVRDRAANGPFRTVDDLQRVTGIGPKKLEQLRDLVTVG